MDEPKLYGELASWWPLLSPPSEYAEEASLYRQVLLGGGSGPLRTLLELGAGGGSNAWYLKTSFETTLVDRSPAMLAVSRSLNPECEHLEGDMRTVRLGRLFDAVFIHDAISYMTTEPDLRAALETAFTHCRPGGAALFAPDHVRESFHPCTSHGGADGGSRALRYLEWTWDPDPGDTVYVTDYAYLLRDERGTVRVEYDRHTLGLFSLSQWRQLMEEVGFEAQVIPLEPREAAQEAGPVFLGVRPAG